MAIFNQYPAAPNSTTAGVLDKVSKNFPSPWLDPASTELPTDLEQVYKFCELLWYANGTYQQAMRRIASYFVTRVKIEDVNGAEKDKWEDFFENRFNLTSFLVSTGINFLAYGNVFASPKLLIARQLRCTCGQLAPLEKWKFKFNRGEFTTDGACPVCRKRSKLEKIDQRSTSKKAIGLRLWNPHQMRVKHNELSDTSIYHYELGSRITEQIRRGDADVLATTLWPFVQCAVANKPMRFNPEMIFHLKDVPLVGIDADGLGLPKGMANFRQAYLTQAYKRLNMVLAIEYSTPMRSVTPSPGMGQMDPTMGLDMSEITGKLTGLLSDWKKDPAAIHTFPIPLQYTAWGGEGLQMASYQLQEQAMNELLTGLGVPVEFFTGSFRSERTFVPALRLMERTWSELVAGYNEMLAWIAEVLSDILKYPKPKLSLESTTIANDLEFKQIMFELMAQGQISRRRALETYGIDPIEENKQILEEQRELQEQADIAQIGQQKQTQGLQAVTLGQPADPAQQQPQQAGAAPLPSAGVPTGAMANTPTRPDDVLAQAQQIAQQLVSQPEEARHQPLAQIKRENELLHAAVLNEMKKLRNQAATQAKQQMSAGGQQQ